MDEHIKVTLEEIHKLCTSNTVKSLSAYDLRERLRIIGNISKLCLPKDNT